ncbi:MAG: YggS family pyridoxal phosphate-dependent enzyme [Lentisphaerae bacterium]|jgi:pyridoxal phosphate enzyme (YggS family)|nr:YggS family pyridoxal phosphate-dependent enzyme [Lentisphaerota bacterium]
MANSDEIPIADALRRVEERIAAACATAGRDPSEVGIVGVSKKFGPEIVAEAWEAGIHIFGENRLQEAAYKIPQCLSGPEWHFIGHLQRNKVRHVLALFTTIHAVDSQRLLEQIEADAQAAGVMPNILLEVNVSGESSKFGLKPQEVPLLVRDALCCKNTTLIGLMTMAPFHPEPEQTRPVFSKLRELRQQLEQQFSISLPHLSMGMSNDYEIAVAEGATMVRLGTTLFGGRPTMKDTLRQQLSNGGIWEE